MPVLPSIFERILGVCRMVHLSSRIGLIALVVLTVPAACTPLPIRPESDTVLKPPRMSPDASVVDVFFVRFPFGDEQANSQLWREIDEQHFPNDLRRRLARNGFRVGLVGGQVPSCLAKLLELEGKAAPSGSLEETSLEGMLSAPRVVRRHMPLRSGEPSQIVASEDFGELHLLMCEADGIRGKTYHQAQCRLGITALPESDGSARIEVLPELHHGRAQQRFVGTRYSRRLEAGRAVRAFDDLRLSTILRPGHMLVLSSLPDRRGSLGEHFFTHEMGGQKEQKLLVIRLAQTQHDDLYSPTSALSLDHLDDPAAE